ncbi:hypothetical protein [Corynebacterium pyruviciproducens]
MREYLDPLDKPTLDGPVTVLPTHLPLTGEHVRCVVGYPLGASQTLVKAAEARLAVAMGATEVEYVPRREYLTDPSALLSELIAIKESVSEEIPLGLRVRQGEEEAVREVPAAWVTVS